MMHLSREIRRLQRSWQNQTAWPKRLEWIEIEGVRGWTGQRVEFPFPIVAICGENGTGKSTVIQAAASAYQDPALSRRPSRKSIKYASDFFPNTHWDEINRAAIRFGYTEGNEHKTASIRKPTERWKGNTQRPQRPIEFFDLSRILPVSGRVGYAKIAKSRHKEIRADLFEPDRLDRLSNILGHVYDLAKMALSDVDANRLIPVLRRSASTYSGYHQGQGETTIAELLQADFPQYGLVLIDEIESSLHPRAQRRLIRDLASVCRERELQIVLTTHSPYILEELPQEARIQIFEQSGVRQIMIGVSPQFALTKMDEIIHPECEVYVEDTAAVVLLREILSQKKRDIASRILVTPFGAASVGYQLGIMVKNDRFPRPTGVVLDGDCAPADGCALLPGGDAPERVVFEQLREIKWGDLWTRLSRDISDVSSACQSSLALNDHHDWVNEAAKKLILDENILWHAMCAEWVEKCVESSDIEPIVAYLEDQLLRAG